MIRGNVVIAAEKGSFAGKPRPWVVVQNSLFLDEPSSVTVCAVGTSGHAATFRVAVSPSDANGIEQPSLIFADKIVTMRSEAIDKIAGTLDDFTLAQVDQAIRHWLDL